MKKALKSSNYRIYPNRSQELLFLRTLDACRFLYNNALEDRIYHYSQFKKSVSCFQQQSFLPEIKSLFPEYNNIHSQVLQDVLKRLDKSYKSFFRRIKCGEKPGFPRFKGKYNYDSFIYPQSGFRIDKNGRLFLSKIGHVKIKFHRPIEGKIKTCTIKRTKSGKWEATFSCEIEQENVQIVPSSESKIVAIDLGLKNFIMTDEKEKIALPKFLNKNLDKITNAQRRKEKVKSRERKIEWAKYIARQHEKVVNRRSDWQHKIANRFVQNYDVIILEDLNIRNMLECEENFHAKKRNINDASWHQFANYIAYKAEYAGKLLLQVDPRNTSKKCSQCSNIKHDLTEKDRVYNCDSCGLETDRDYNAALNIRDLGLRQFLIDASRSLGTQAPPETARSLFL